MKNFLEKNLEEIIYTADRHDLAKRGIAIIGQLKRQLRIGNYGVADLVEFRKIRYFFGERAKLDITVYELKKGEINVKTFLQAVRYCRGIQRYFEERGFNDYVLNIVLIGSSIDKSDNFLYLTSLLSNTSKNRLQTVNKIDFYTYSYNIDGIEFNLENDENIDENFPIKIRNFMSHSN